VDSEILPEEESLGETLMLGLRLREGLDLLKLSGVYDIDLAGLFSGTIRSLEGIGMLEVEGDVIRLTREGLFVSNSVISEFMLVQ